MASGWHKWISGYPMDNMANYKQCVVQNETGWKDVMCNTTKGAFCQYTKVTNRETGVVGKIYLLG